MKLLSDLFPIILFFIAYKVWGMYPAIVVAMAVTVIQSIIVKIKRKQLDTMNRVMLILVLVLGSASLFFHNEAFFKWKPTAINWGFAVAFLASHVLGKKPLIRHMMDKEITLPNHIWNRLSYAWVVFFFAMGCLNIFVIYHFDTDTWVNFKLFGVLGITMVFAVLQAIYLSRHMDVDTTPSPPKEI